MHFSATSLYSKDIFASDVALPTGQGWVPDVHDTQKYIVITFDDVYNITNIGVRMRQIHSFRISTSQDNIYWQTYPSVCNLHFLEK